MPRSATAKVIAYIGALVAAFWGFIELYQALSRIKMIFDAINFIADGYYSVTSTVTNFTLWKSNATYLLTQPVFNALPFLQIVPEVVWDICKAIILFYIALLILEWLMR